VRFHPAPGTRNGETWLSVGDTLVVCDSFFNLPGPLSGAMGLVLRATRTGPGLKLGRTFRWLALADVRSYRAWVEDTLDALAPKRVLFSHGDPLEGARLISARRAGFTRLAEQVAHEAPDPVLQLRVEQRQAALRERADGEDAGAELDALRLLQLGQAQRASTRSAPRS
jgi:hypothetical protein